MKIEATSCKRTLFDNLPTGAVFTDEQSMQSGIDARRIFIKTDYFNSSGMRRISINLQSGEPQFIIDDCYVIEFDAKLVITTK